MSKEQGSYNWGLARWLLAWSVHDCWIRAEAFLQSATAIVRNPERLAALHSWPSQKESAQGPSITALKGPIGAKGHLKDPQGLFKTLLEHTSQNFDLCILQKVCPRMEVLSFNGRGYIFHCICFLNFCATVRLPQGCLQHIKNII